jgi:hypothetical protein
MPMRRPFAAIPAPARTSLLVVALIVVALIVAACASPGGSSPASNGGPSQAGTGNGGNTSEPGTTLTACELVTPADIEAALDLDAGAAAEGRFVENPSEDHPYANQCSYLAGAWGSLTASVLPSSGAGYYESLVPQLGDRAEALDIGDGGLWVEDIERGYFLKGTVLVTISIIRIVEPTPFREPTIALGEAAVAKL